ncbi:MAG: hypothetical protein F9K13_03225 [Candidatus Methylomirabilis oxygeniifera]|uniref:Lipoprotein n=1 Tax=Methylomirabilis oxygeniifera TaxID=671143 RepID=D5MFI0_METO1|nr:MAG: hypothetical protein F9K13_03225 [Candidatus Methylomirabilis oxyfera]CBE68511.1 exported protein of unknown function [Candidatus Methylomirabilis oxyfera]
MKRALTFVVLAIALSGCASLAVRPCDSIATRDSKYAARFFLGIITLGISEAGIQHEQFLEASEGWRFCSPRVAWQGPPQAMGTPRTPGTLINVTKWTVNVYLDVDPASAGIPPLFTLRPGESRQLALAPGPHRIVARPTVETVGGTAPSERYDRQIQIDPRDRSFRLQLSEGEFK